MPIYLLSIVLSMLFFPIVASCETNPGDKPGLNVDSPGALYFTPPEGWSQAAPEFLPGNMLVLAIGQAKSTLPPSINVSSERFKGTIKDYLKIIKSINTRKGGVWKDLGKIRTAAGEGSFSQLDIKSAAGDVRMLHAIILKNETIYIMTATALQEEFSSYYKLFFDAIRSLHIND